MNLIRQKVSNFQIQIRKTYRQKHFQQIRKNMMVSDQVNNDLQNFIEQHSHQIPEICARQFNSIDKDHLEKAINLLSSSKVIFFRDQNNINVDGDQWYWDCSNSNNIQFMVSCCQKGWNPILRKFFDATIKAHKRYVQAERRFQLTVKQSQCFIQDSFSSKSFEQRQELEKSEKTFLSILKFWSQYIQVCHEQIFLEAFETMIMSFSYWHELTQITQHSESYQFIQTILKYFINSKIFQNKCSSRANLSNFRQLIEGFLFKVKIILQTALQNYGFSWIGQIFLQFTYLNEFYPGIFYQVVFRKQILLKYFNRLFQGQEITINRVIALLICDKLINCSNIQQILGQEESIILIGKILDICLYDQQKDIYNFTITMLERLVDLDYKEQLFVSIFQNIRYESIIRHDSAQSYNFFIKIMNNYKENNVIYQKLLKQCQFQSTLRAYVKEYQLQSLYVQFCILINKNMDYFIKQYPRQVEFAVAEASQMDFKGREEFLKEMHEHLALFRSEGQL